MCCWILTSNCSIWLILLFFPTHPEKTIQINKVFVDEMVGKVLYHLYFQGCPMNSALDSFDLFYLDNKNMKLVNVNFIYVFRQ